MKHSHIQKFCIKDSQHKLVWANQAFLDCIGFKSLDSSSGITDYVLPWQKYADIYKQHELDTLKGNSYSTLQPIRDGEGNNFIGLITKFLKDDKTGNKMIHTTFNEVVNVPINAVVSTLLEFDNFNKEKCYSIKNGESAFSSRELECLFYLIRGKSAKIIGKILNISPRTVEQYVENIKIKLDCQSRCDIIEAAINKGLVNIIPSSLFRKVERLASALKE